jgi:hypothetical protein
MNRLLIMAAFALPVLLTDGPTGPARVEAITRDGTTWTASTWAYTTPKLLWDGARAYAVALVGEGPGKDVARLYWRNTTGWHAGADVQPVYQPATLLLDDEGHVHLFCTDRGRRGYHWRSVRPADVTAFTQVALPGAEKFAYGYLGAGRDGATLALAGLDRDYSMWIAVKRGAAAWTRPRLLARSESARPPVKSPLYPVVIPRGDEVDVVFSHTSDGSTQNTYDRVEHALYDAAAGRVVRHEVIAEGPVGEITYGLDALRAADGSLYALYMAGLRKYGEERADRERRQGLYCAALRPGSSGWSVSRVTSSTGTAQLCQSPDGNLHVFESTSGGTRHHLSTDGGRTWSPAPSEVAWSQGAFLYVLKPNSGSVQDTKLRAVQSSALPQGSRGRYGLDYIELGWPDPRPRGSPDG